MWDMEERHMRERHQLAEQLLKNKFTLKRSLMMQRHSKVVQEIFIIIIVIIRFLAWQMFFNELLQTIIKG